MKNRNILLVLILLASLAAGWLIYWISSKQSVPTSSETNATMEVGYGKNYTQLSRYIGFNDKQQEIFQTMEKEYWQNVSSLRNEIFEVEAAIMAELNKQKPNNDLLKELSQKVGNKHTAIKELTIEHFLAIKNICTPEQEEKMSAIFTRLEQRSNFRKNRREGPNRQFRQRRGGFFQKEN